MTDVIKALKARVEFDVRDNDASGINGHLKGTERQALRNSARFENARLIPIIEKLIAVAKAADAMVNGANLYDGTNRVDNALADLRAAVLPEGK